MRTTSIAMAALIGALALLPGDARAQDERPADVATRLANVGSVLAGDPFWAGDGRLLYPSSLGGPALWGVDPDGGPPRRIIDGVGGSLLRASPAGGLVAYLSNASGNPEIWLADLTSGTTRQLTALGARINALAFSPDGGTVAFSALRYGQFDLWRVDVASGAVSRLTDDPRYETYPAWTPDGRQLVYVRSDDRWADHEILVMPATGGPSRVIATDRDLFDYGTIGTRSRFGYPLVSPDGRSVLFRSHRSGWLNYWVAGLDGGAPRALAPESADQDEAAWSPDGRTVAFTSNRNGTVDLRSVPAGGGSARVIVPVERGVISAPAWSRDGRRIAYVMATPTRPQDLHLVAADGSDPRRLTVSIDPSVEARLVAPEKIEYASDEFRIAAYLFRPPGLKPGTRVPAIVYAHGGPTGQFSDTYQAQPQFLARMGFMVLAPNIRGSSGYGKAFEDANNPCWTHCDLHDIVAAAALLRRMPEVDADRLAITGISYGGIISMGAVAHAPEVFQAAIPQSGYADWISFQDYNTELQHTKLLAYEWGPYPDSAAVYRRNSSIFSAHRVTAPVFLIHGEGRSDPWRPGVYPIPASREVAHALDKQNKVVRYRVYPGETYYVNGRQNVARVMLDILDFLNQYLRDDVVPTSPVDASASRPDEQR